MFLADVFHCFLYVIQINAQVAQQNRLRLLSYLSQFMIHNLTFSAT
jgi:hypothetical protein